MKGLQMKTTDIVPGVLCYVDGPWAWFTTQKLFDQWGDDWDDAPYECNAGDPYSYCEQTNSGCRCINADGPIAFGGGAMCGQIGHVPSPPQKPWVLTKVAWDGLFVPPSLGLNNSPYSVSSINCGAVAWLRPERGMPSVLPIPAGVLFEEFCARIRAGGGHVYVGMD